jgi:hypothetical protein
MKLLFELPEKEQKLAEKVLNGKKILCCVPFDLNDSGGYTCGWLIITSKIYIIIENGKLLVHQSIAKGENYKLVSNIGNGTIEASFKGEDRIIVRFSMSHLPRYTYVARILDGLSKGEVHRVKAMTMRICVPNVVSLFQKVQRYVDTV